VALGWRRREITDTNTDEDADTNVTVEKEQCNEIMNKRESMHV